MSQELCGKLSHADLGEGPIGVRTGGSGDRQCRDSSGLWGSQTSWAVPRCCWFGPDTCEGAWKPRPFPAEMWGLGDARQMAACVDREEIREGKFPS